MALVGPEKTRAGRPDVDRLRIRAYPTEAPCEPQPQEIVLTRQCTRLVLEWAPAPARRG